MVLAFGDLLAEPQQNRGAHAMVFVLAYLGVALGLLLLQYVPRLGDWRVPLAADVTALGVFLMLTHSAAAFWFVYLFVALAAGTRWGLERSVVLAGAVTLGVLLRATLQGGFGWEQVLSWIALTVGTFTAGVGLSFVGDGNRRHAAEHDYLSRLTGMLQIEQGVTESLRMMLEELAQGFNAEKAIFAFRDAEIERVLVWSVDIGQPGRISPENLPLPRGDAFLLDRPEAVLCWNRLDSVSAGFGWNRYDGREVRELPLMPVAVQQALRLRSLMSVPFDFGGHPAGRIFIGNTAVQFLSQDLHWFERVVRHLAPPLENLFLLRRLRTRAIEGERSRISRDIHDGILQTLLKRGYSAGCPTPQGAAERRNRWARSWVHCSKPSVTKLRSCGAWSRTCALSACRAQIWWI